MVAPGFAKVHARAEAIGRLESIVYLNTTLNTGHAHGLARETIILPVLARDEEAQATTQESMFNRVRLSAGGPRRLEGPRSEVEIIAALAQRILPSSATLDWQQLADHTQIRQMIAAEEGDADSKTLSLSREKCLEQIELLQKQKADLEEGLSELYRIHSQLSGKIADKDRRTG